MTGKREERESQLVPVAATEGRSREMGGFMMRESLLKKMKKGIDAGLAFPDAAKAAGIPYELVVSALSHDTELRGWFKISAGRKSLIRSQDAHTLPTVRSTMEIKKELTNLIFSSGLGERFAETAAHLQVIDPHTGEFNKEHLAIMFALGKLGFSLLPKENEIAQTEVEAKVEKRSEQDIMQELITMREERLRLEAGDQRAIQARGTGGRSLEGPASVEPSSPFVR